MPTLTKTATITFSGESELDCLMQAVAWIRNCGFCVIETTQPWETPAAFCKRLGICSQTLIRKLKSPHSPGVATQRANGPKSRLLRLSSNAAFDAFCVLNKLA